MKFAKLSLAAIAVMGMASGAFAGENKITFNPFGSAKLYYESSTTDGATDGTEDLFAKKGASGGALVSGGATGKINSCFGYGFEAMAVDTLGLEGNLVSGVRMGNANSAPKDALDTQFWFPQAYITYHPCDMGTNTTFKIGRQYLDTPLAFTERWNIAPNSFDAIVALNQDIINTTIVGAYVGRGNGVFKAVTNGSDFSTYGTNALAGGADALGVTGGAKTAHLANAGGAYAVGVITSLLDGTLPISVWGYDVDDVANAAWADAGYKLDLGDGMKFDLGLQYGYVDPAGATQDALKAVLGKSDSTSGYGVKLGGNVSLADMNFGLSAAYSSVDKDGVIALANTATVTAHHGMVGGKKTKLYTADIYTDGTHVAMPGSDAYRIAASTKLKGIGGLTIGYTHNENDNNNKLDVDEIDTILSTNILPGGLNTKLIYMIRDYDQKSVADHTHLRLILSKKF